MTINPDQLLGITFDAAKTLIYTTNWSRDYRLMSDYLVDQGLEIYPQELEAARNYVFFHDLPVLGIDNWPDWTTQILHRCDIKSDQISSSLVTGLSSILQEVSLGFHLYDDVLPIFRYLSDFDLSLSIVTTIPYFKLEQVLHPIRQQLDHIIHGGNAGCAKGNPKMYQLDLDKKGINPSANLFIGDNPYLDIEVPQSMGQQTIYIDRTGQSELEMADLSITSLMRLMDIFR